MSNEYSYLDPDYKYTDPETGILRNLANTDNKEVFLFIESGAVAKRIKELYDNPIEIRGVKTLFVIHKHLFQDIYSWAGQERTVEISKEGKQFFPTTHFKNAYQYVDKLILEYRNIPKSNRNNIAQKLAEILDNINYLHPFREGNGRAQREFIRLLSLERGIKLNLNPPDNENAYSKYMRGMINGDTKLLTELILELIK